MTWTGLPSPNRVSKLVVPLFCSGLPTWSGGGVRICPGGVCAAICNREAVGIGGSRGEGVGPLVFQSIKARARRPAALLLPVADKRSLGLPLDFTWHLRALVLGKVPAPFAALGRAPSFLGGRKGRSDS